MALGAIEYRLKNIFDDYDSFISPSWLPFIKIKEPESLRVKFDNLLGEYLECSW